MKRGLFLYALLIGSALMYAQNGSAENILDKAAKNYKKAFYIEFDYNLKSADGTINQTETGKIFAKKKKYSLTLNTQKVNQVYNGSKLYTVNHEDKEVVVDKPKDESDLLTPTKILNSYKTGYSSKKGTNTTVNGKKCFSITLTPTKSSSGIKTVKVYINTSNYQIEKLEETNKENTKTTLTVKSFIANMIVTKATFEVNTANYKSKGYIITDNT